MNTRLLEEAQELMADAEQTRQAWLLATTEEDNTTLRELFIEKFQLASDAVRTATEAAPD